MTILKLEIFPHQYSGHWQADRAGQQVVQEHDPVRQQHEGVLVRGEGEEGEKVAEGECKINSILVIAKLLMNAIDFNMWALWLCILLNKQRKQV